MPIGIIKRHYNNDLAKLDFDLFDAIDRRCQIQYMGFDPRSEQVFRAEYEKEMDKLRSCFGNKSIPLIE